MKNRERLSSKNGFSLDKIILKDDEGKILEVFYEVISPSGVVMSSSHSLQAALLNFNTLVNDAKPKPIVNTRDDIGPSM